VAFSDQQIITGISIIIGGLSQLQWGISLYHWQAVVNLAWFSTVTHLITLTVLREEVRSNKPIKIFRTVGMRILVVMLICVMAPIGYLTSPFPPPIAFPAWCLYQPGIEWVDLESGPLNKQYNWLYIVIALNILIFNYFIQVVLFFSENIGLSTAILRIRPGQF
jgi:hypothetical protein